MKAKKRFLYLHPAEKKEIITRIAAFMLIDFILNMCAKEFFLQVYVFPFLALPVFAFHFSFIFGFVFAFLVFAIYFASFFLRLKWLFVIVALMFSFSRIVATKSVVPVITFVMFLAWCMLFDRNISYGMFVKSSLLSVLFLFIFRKFVAFSFEKN